jgi:photosystem II stability/assembly factor-like uncharacterized protein
MSGSPFMGPLDVRSQRRLRVVPSGRLCFPWKGSAVAIVVIILLISQVWMACGIFGPEDGAEWTSLGLDGRSVTALVQTDWGLFAGSQFAGVFRFDEDNVTWRALGLQHAVISTLLFVPGTPARLLVGVEPYEFGQTTEAAVYASTDAGETWVPADGGLAASHDGNFWAVSLALDVGPPERMYIGKSLSVLRSDDGGQSWTYVLFDETSTGQGVHSILISPRHDGMMWASLQTPLGVSWIHRSPDWGDSWQGSLPFPRLEAAFYSLMVDPEVPTTLWAGMDGGVIRSDDEGETWAVSLSEDASVTDLLSANGDMLAVANHIEFPDSLGPVTEQLRLYRRSKGTQTWASIQVAPEIGGSLSATLDAQGRLVVGTRGTGVWRWVP